MKQKVTVRAYIKQEGKILLIRRASGNETLLGKYELPGGKLEYGEQPIDALQRELAEELGVETETVQLYDVLTHVDEANHDLHYVTIVYQVSLAAHTRTIKLSPDHSKYVWEKLSEVQREELTDSTNIILGIDNSKDYTGVIDYKNSIKVDNITSNNHVVIYSDGGSRGNPGPSAAGFVIMNSDETVIVEGGKYLGITTNNQAEYQAVCLALEKARELGAREIDFRLDSLLVVNQLSGIYQIKNRDLWPVHARIKELTDSFHRVSFRHVKREFNKLADGMVNKVLDEQMTS